jgi:uncharacterized membrane protein YhiD involved in acid resistance
MSASELADAVSHWPYLPTLIRIALAVGCGVFFVGLEREYHGKAGARTFGLAALLGCLGGLSGQSFAILSMAFLGVMVCFLNLRQFSLHQALGLTTSAAFLIVGFAGVLCGQGHTFTPVAVSVVTAALLAWKEPISGFAVGLSDRELRSAILIRIAYGKPLKRSKRYVRELTKGRGLCADARRLHHMRRLPQPEKDCKFAKEFGWSRH